MLKNGSLKLWSVSLLGKHIKVKELGKRKLFFDDKKYLFVIIEET